MSGFRWPTAGIALPVVLFLAACQEDEQSCFDRISADLEQSRDLSNKRGDRALALVAAESGVAAAVIFTDDDRNICDYVTAGAYLQRK